MKTKGTTDKENGTKNKKSNSKFVMEQKFLNGIGAKKYKNN